jgi:hypothetical protein
MFPHANTILIVMSYVGLGWLTVPGLLVVIYGRVKNTRASGVPAHRSIRPYEEPFHETIHAA